MAKLSGNAIIQSDLTEYLSNFSDFSFEISVLKMLRDNGLTCEHGGHYEDPVTGKSREFDIRATKTIQNRRIRLAVECKNIRENFPILISCLHRHESESYHSVVRLQDQSQQSSLIPNLHDCRAKQFKIKSNNSFYKVSEPVGKSTAQVGKNAHDGEITSNDSELYEKWGQCLSSASDLVSDVYFDGRTEKTPYLSSVFPFVVVPNGRLWSCLYDDRGNLIQPPMQTERVSCFIDKSYELGPAVAQTTFNISHLEVVTYDGMLKFIDDHLKTLEGISKIFPFR